MNEAVIKKLEAIGSTIIGTPEPCWGRKVQVAVGQWFFINGSNPRKYYIVTEAEQPFTITQSMVDRDTTGKYDGAHLGWQQPYTRVEISRPTKV